MNASQLEFSLSWVAGCGLAERLTTATLAISLDGECVWPVEGASQVTLEIQSDDLLSYLTEFWKPLVLRQTYPVPVIPERPSALRLEAEKRWESQSVEIIDREEEQVTAFEEAHDMSRCFAGLFDLPPFWLMRAGDRMRIDTRAKLRSVGFEAAEQALSKIGNEIATRLASSRTQRWDHLIEAWNARDEGEPAVLLAWSASLERDVARSFVGDGTLSAPTTVTEATNDNDELRIAARMASALPPAQIRQIVNLVRSFPKQAAPALDQLALRSRFYIEQNFAAHRAHHQGEAAASFVRDALGLAAVQYIDIYALVQELGVSIHHSAVEPPTLDGLAVWGDKHGPSVLLNEASRRVAGRGNLQHSAPARITLAHELCHLLLDRGHTLTAVDVLNSRMPPEIERRAKAFAGELLLPGRVAADNWMRSNCPRSVPELKKFIRTLSGKYRVPMTVTSWKIEHGLHRHDIDLTHELDLAVPFR